MSNSRYARARSEGVSISPGGGVVMRHWPSTLRSLKSAVTAPPALTYSPCWLRLAIRAALKVTSAGLLSLGLAVEPSKIVAPSAGFHALAASLVRNSRATAWSSSKDAAAKMKPSTICCWVIPLRGGWPIERVLGWSGSAATDAPCRTGPEVGIPEQPTTSASTTSPTASAAGTTRAPDPLARLDILAPRTGPDGQRDASAGSRVRRLEGHR